MVHIDRHRLENKFKISNLLICFLCFYLAACSTLNNGKNNLLNKFNPDEVIQILGLEKAATIEKFAEIVNENDKNKDEVLIKESFVYNNEPIEVKLIFENDILFRVQYNFKDKNETAFKFKDEVISKIKGKYGETDTYVTLPNRIEGLTCERYLEENQPQYKEYWIGDNKDLSKAIPNKYKESKRVDLGIEINKIKKEKTETVIVIGGIVNNNETKKIKN